MSDSEDELLPDNILTFQNQGTTVCAKGPKINSTSISGLSFRNNVLSSTMNMPWNLETRQQPDMLYHQRSTSHRRNREGSPMSLHSPSGMQRRNLTSSYYGGGLSSCRSMYNGRSRSLVSVRSLSRTIDSNTSMSAKDIAFAFQTGNFNKFDLKIIKEAYTKYLKSRHRRRVEKKRNMKMFLKGFRRRSGGGDSGDQASNSSISSDDGQSIRSSRSALHKNLITSCRSTAKPESFNTIHLPKWRSTSISSKKENVRSNFLPSQRFHQSVSLAIGRSSRLENIYENIIFDTKNQQQQKRKVNEPDSEDDEIFETDIEKNNDGKRTLEDTYESNSKRSRLSPSHKHIEQKGPKVKMNQLNTSAKQNDLITSCRSTAKPESFNTRAVRENDMVRDCSQYLKQNAFKTMLQVRSTNSKEIHLPKWQSTSISSKKENVRSNFLLPSQRFHQSVSSTIERSSRLENIYENNILDTKNQQQQQKRKVNEPEDDEIFEIDIEKNNDSKRTLGDTFESNSKRSRLSASHKKIEQKSPKVTKINQLNRSAKQNDFMFAKPQVPLKKFGIVKNTKKNVISSKSQDKSISLKDNIPVATKSAEPNTENLVAKGMVQPIEKLISSSQRAQEKSTQSLVLKPSASNMLQSNVGLNSQTDTTQLSTTDMSMRSSFIKRKLFTQKVDESAKNSSSDSLQADSPQNNIYSKIQKEKNKARKLATQSCLNREVGDDSNLLDLIHKIVPRDSMNVTSANKTEISNNNISDKVDKWDVTSVISNCNNDNVSDTFTDEEDIFTSEGKEKQANQQDTKHKNYQKEVSEIQEKQNKTQIETINNVRKTPTKIKRMLVVESDSGNTIPEKQSKTTMEQKQNCVKSISKKPNKCGIGNNTSKNEKNQTNASQTGKADNEKQTKPMTVQAINEKSPKALLKKQNQVLAEKPIKTSAKKQSNNAINIVIEKQPGFLKKGSVKPTRTTQKTNLPKFLAVLQKMDVPAKHITNGLTSCERNESTKANVYKSIKSFWDTDAESDLEATPAKKSTFMECGNLVLKPSVRQPVVNTNKNMTSLSQQLKTNDNNNLTITLEKKIVGSLNNNKLQTENEKNDTIQNNLSQNNNKNSTKQINDSSDCPKVSNLPVHKTKRKLNKAEDKPSKTITSNKKASSSTKENKPPSKKITDQIKNEGETILPSDLSFTLTTDAPAANRTIRTRRTAFNSKSTKARKSNASFSLHTDDMAAYTNRTSKRIKEIEALKNNSASFYNNSAGSLDKKLPPAHLTVNRSKSRR